eukprot:scaffold999_cov375-Prasinococcus_capsulatus_cf.AAC.1
MRFPASNPYLLDSRNVNRGAAAWDSARESFAIGGLYAQPDDTLEASRYRILSRMPVQALDLRQGVGIHLRFPGDYRVRPHGVHSLCVAPGIARIVVIPVLAAIQACMRSQRASPQVRATQNVKAT